MYACMFLGDWANTIPLVSKQHSLTAQFKTIVSTALFCFCCYSHDVHTKQNKYTKPSRFKLSSIYCLPFSNENYFSTPIWKKTSHKMYRTLLKDTKANNFSTVRQSNISFQTRYRYHDVYFSWIFLAQAMIASVESWNNLSHSSASSKRWLSVWKVETTAPILVPVASDDCQCGKLKQPLPF